jgi:hypothetical protein
MHAGRLPVLDLDHQHAEPGADYDQVRITMPDLNVIIHVDIFRKRGQDSEE